MSNKNRRVFDQEFKREAVRLARESGRPKAQIARELGISDGLLHKWLGQYDDAKARGLTPEQLKAEQEDLRRLRADVKRLKLENEILKKAAAYFAKEST